MFKFLFILIIFGLLIVPPAAGGITKVGDIATAAMGSYPSMIVFGIFGFVV